MLPSDQLPSSAHDNFKTLNKGARTAVDAEIPIKQYTLCLSVDGVMWPRSHFGYSWGLEMVVDPMGKKLLL
jgi:hypothetical protein